MIMKYIIAQIFGIIGPSLKIVGIQFKNKEKVLFNFILVNLIIGIELVLLEAYSGAIVSLIAVIETLINYIYNKKNKKLPNYFICIYILISIIAGILTYKIKMDILATVCAILYIVSICQTKEKNLRLISLFSICIWIIYNIYFKAYTDTCFKIGFLISTMIAIYRYDIKKSDKKIRNREE